MIGVRFFMRFLLVPLAGLVAAVVAAFVVCFAQWTALTAIIEKYPQDPDDYLLGLLFIGFSIGTVMTIGAIVMLTVAIIGVAISEVFAIRSWMFHAANGALASFIGWMTFAKPLSEFKLYNEPTIMVAAGLAGGLAYWAIAGWNAGFWKPIFVQSESSHPAAAQNP